MKKPLLRHAGHGRPDVRHAVGLHPDADGNRGSATCAAAFFKLADEGLRGARVRWSTTSTWARSATTFGRQRVAGHPAGMMWFALNPNGRAIVDEKIWHRRRRQPQHSRHEARVMRTIFVTALLCCSPRDVPRRGCTQWGGYEQGPLRRLHVTRTQIENPRVKPRTHIAAMESASQKVAPGLYAELGNDLSASCHRQGYRAIPKERDARAGKPGTDDRHDPESERHKQVLIWRSHMK